MVGDEVELVTGPGLGSDGEAVGRLPEGQVVFVRGAAPHEQVRARITQAAKRVLHAQLLEVLRPGPSRIEPECPVAGRCGGCALLHLDRETELDAKTDAGRETLARIGGLRRPHLDAVRPWRGPEARERARARLAFSGGQLGFRAFRSHEIVPVDTCRALSPVLENARREWERWAAEHPHRSGELALVTDGARVSAFVPDASIPGASDQILEREDDVGPLRLRASLFSQASLRGSDALLAEVAQVLPERGKRALELHAGSGNFTRLLASRFDRVVAVESHRPSVEVGESLGLSNVEWRAERDVAGYRASAPAELLFVDPPRAGLGKALTRAIGERPPRAFVYLSCHVGSMARDLRALVDSGLEVDGVRAFDLYPRTPHMEWMVVGRFRSAKEVVSGHSRS